MGQSLLPSIQRLVAVTMLTGVGPAAAVVARVDSAPRTGGVIGSVDGEAGGANAAPQEVSEGGGGGDDDDETRGPNAAAHKKGSAAGGVEDKLLRNSRGLFRYELIRDSDEIDGASPKAGGEGGNGNGPGAGPAAAGTPGAGATASSRSTMSSPPGPPSAQSSGRDLSMSGGSGSSSRHVPRQQRSLLSLSSSRGGDGAAARAAGGVGDTTSRSNIRSADGTRGIRVRLKRLIEGPSLGRERRRLQEQLLGQTPVFSGEGVIFEAVQEGSGSASWTVVRVLSR